MCVTTWNFAGKIELTMVELGDQTKQITFVGIASGTKRFILIY